MRVRALMGAGVIGVAMMACAPATGVAAETAWLSAGPMAGSLGLDADLADYRWDTRPTPQWGAQVLFGRGRLAVGLTAWRASTTQGTGLPEAETDPRVALTTAAAMALVRVASPLGCELWLGGQAGRLQLRWEPRTLSVDLGTGAGPVTVEFEDVGEWSLGAVAELRRPLGRGLTAALQFEESGFALDTAHRRGDLIVNGRDRFINWSARVQLAWRQAL